MKRISWTAIAIIGLSLIAIVLTSNPGLAQLISPSGFELPGRVPPALSAQSSQDLDSTACALQPDPKAAPRLSRSASRVTLTRFRQASTSADAPAYMPKEEIALADASNFGDRYLRDVNGNPVKFEPIVVLHETVGSADSAINLFSAYHAEDADQVSYHTLIRQNGNLVYIVPPDKRAYGAGVSVFSGRNGNESVRLHPDLPASVNNFAYHISLESPTDGFNNGFQHSGYTPAQYQSLAWLIAKTGVLDDRITTHKAVDRSGQRIDPRSFDRAKFLQLLSAYPKTNAIALGCS